MVSIDIFDVEEVKYSIVEMTTTCVNRIRIDTKKGMVDINLFAKGKESLEINK